MKYKAFLDTPVFIYSHEFPHSNSRKILSLLLEGKIVAFASERVVKEVSRYFEKFYSVELARLYRRLVIKSCIVIPENLVKEIMTELKGTIKEKDLEQLAVTRKYRLQYLISYDKDFRKVKEYITPKAFMKIVGFKQEKEEY